MTWHALISKTRVVSAIERYDICNVYNRELMDFDWLEGFHASISNDVIRLGQGSQPEHSQPSPQHRPSVSHNQVAA